MEAPTPPTRPTSPGLAEPGAAAADAADADDETALLATIGLELDGPRHDALRAALAPVVRRLRERGARVIGFVPADAAIAVPPVLIQLGLALCEATGETVAVVDANVRYPGLPMLARGHAPDRAGSVFATRWLRGSLALLSPPHVESAGDVVPQLARVLLEGAELFGHVLVDLTGFDRLGEHGSAAACMDAVVLVGRARATREDELLALARMMPRARLAGVLLVG